ncbi:MAG: peptide chain release factor N(5)-glutamine methyltransferase [Halothermotrichaceae bacterium]
MNIKKVLINAVDYLKKHNIPNSRLEAEVLLAHVLHIERIQLYVKYDLPLKKNELEKYRELIVKRAKRTPTAYLTGVKEFMSLDFTVNNKVLIPRPETEILVEKVIEYCQEQEMDSPNIVDIGTGSGVIAVSLGYNIKNARVFGIDISSEALKIACRNISKFDLGDRVKVTRGNLLQPLIKLDKDNVDIVISNPPYISSQKMKELMPEVQREPDLALAAGADGLKFYREIIPQSARVLKAGGLLALEIGYAQGDAVKKLFDSSWQNVRVEKDYSDHDRMVFANLK